MISLASVRLETDRPPRPMASSLRRGGSRQEAVPGRGTQALGGASRLLDDIVLVLLKDRQKLFLLPESYAVFFQRSRDALQGGLPLCLDDAEAAVRGLHVPASVHTRASGNRADLVDQQLTGALAGVQTSPSAEAANLGSLPNRLKNSSMTAAITSYPPRRR